jgi:hypothetical protein
LTVLSITVHYDFAEFPEPADRRIRNLGTPAFLAFVLAVVVGYFAGRMAAMLDWFE